MACPDASFACAPVAAFTESPEPWHPDFVQVSEALVLALWHVRHFAGVLATLWMRATLVPPLWQPATVQLLAADAT